MPLGAFKVALLGASAASPSFDVLVVAGGGGGVGGGYGSGGAGGAGGLVYVESYPNEAGVVYDLTIGAGGAGKYWAAGGVGVDSVFNVLAIFNGLSFILLERIKAILVAKSP